MALLGMGTASRRGRRGLARGTQSCLALLHSALKKAIVGGCPRSLHHHIYSPVYSHSGRTRAYGLVSVKILLSLVNTLLLDAG